MFHFEMIMGVIGENVKFVLRINFRVTIRNALKIINSNCFAYFKE